ncbi:MAG: MOSC domain-containing protein [Candidatus Electrothrix sp. AW2]|nr:MOSC domain-containing protein [Candidatus Electrothrix sp. AX1]MCI5116587.1 MOSC domain-containing protein [Candidatus Electrothrix gigas]MCI5127939.1 MOSC domain-containing protein [Candidatus Electrothrix gigas]MCI5135400.1 MOSC domain-containing protein [Candidatus Electrothrix gigas]MCI5178456.1 MOSC domain-containing protein [Candidatus Electrothrix gigas]
MSTVEAICISKKKGIPKSAIEQATFQVGFGIVNDAHGGDWHRQISLLAGESIDRVKKILPQLSQGAFAENIITRGLDLTTVAVGDRVQIGADIVLEITQLGKKCHDDGCAIKKATGDCIMPREGIFAKVLQGGTARPSDTIMLEPRNTTSE